MPKHSKTRATTDEPSTTQAVGSASRNRHDAINMLMVIDLACENLLAQLAPGDPIREDIEQIAEARRQLVIYLDDKST
jgi:hypothetical protein